MLKTLTTNLHHRLVRMLIEHRDHAGLTQTQLAKKIGEYQSFVARIESGQRRVDVVEFIKLGEAIGFDPVKLLSRLTKASKSE